MNVLVRADASIRIGSGHVMRCLVLAERLREDGSEIVFICSNCSGHMKELIEERGFKVCLIPVDEDKHSWESDVNSVLSVIDELDVSFDCLIVDHYELDKRWEESFRDRVKQILVIDDLADREHDCDILLDQNFYQSDDRYSGMLPESCVRLLGSEYVLLRDEFLNARCNLKERSGVVQKLLVSFGGSDNMHQTEKVLAAVKELGSRDFHVDVIIGHSNPRKVELEKTIESIPGVCSHSHIDDMARMMTESDLSISAGGIFTWERSCLGLPGIAWSVADNQVEPLQALAEIKALHYLGKAEDVTVEMIVQAIVMLCEEHEYYHLLSAKGMELVDGNGVAKVLNQLQDGLRDSV